MEYVRVIYRDEMLIRLDRGETVNPQLLMPPRIIELYRSELREETPADTLFNYIERFGKKPDRANCIILWETKHAGVEFGSLLFRHLYQFCRVED